jgi:hypothetical protein
MPECGNDTIKLSLMHYGTASTLINSYGNYLPSDAVSYPKRLESALTLLQQRTFLANQRRFTRNCNGTSNSGTACYQCLVPKNVKLSYTTV